MALPKLFPVELLQILKRKLFKEFPRKKTNEFSSSEIYFQKNNWLWNFKKKNRKIPEGFSDETSIWSLIKFACNPLQKLFRQISKELWQVAKQLPTNLSKELPKNRNWIIYEISWKLLKGIQINRRKITTTCAAHTSKGCTAVFPQFLMALWKKFPGTKKENSWKNIMEFQKNCQRNF